MALVGVNVDVVSRSRSNAASLTRTIDRMIDRGGNVGKRENRRKEELGQTGRLESSIADRSLWSAKSLLRSELATRINEL